MIFHALTGESGKEARKDRRPELCRRATMIGTDDNAARPIGRGSHGSDSCPRCVHEPDASHYWAAAGEILWSMPAEETWEPGSINMQDTYLS